jgi:Ca-activated chloride channel family protein
MSAKLVAGAVLCSVLAATAAVSQDVYVTLVQVHFFVTDRNGVFVKDVSPESLKVYDNDRPQKIATFAQNVQSPVSVALVLDRSESVKDRFSAVLDAAAAFSKSIIRARDDQGAVIAFDSKVYLLQNWTTDSAAIVDTIHKLSAAGGTSLFDALLKTCRDRFDGDDVRQKVVVLVTDGEDTTSAATFDEALRMAKLARVTLYVLGVRAENSLNTRELQGRRVLANLAELTGGRVFYPADYRDGSLSAVFAQLQEELRNGYNLTYYLDVPPGNTFHQIRIETTNPSLKVHALTGYYPGQRKLGQ